MAHIQGVAVSIYGKKGTNPEIFGPNSEALRAVLDQDHIRELPIVVIPVAGEYRGGKSFLLSYFIRYLATKNVGGKDENEKLVGFDFKKCKDPVTQGIKIWNQPFIVEENNLDGSSQKMVVLLMDSQGILAGKDDNKHSTLTFALSTMLSSIMIFNLKSQLNEGILSYLKLFTSYANQVSVDRENEAPFQKLMILIRDWEGDNEFGFIPGDKYLKDYCKDTQGKYFDSFEDTKCFLMPHPGKCIRNKDYNGCFRELDKEFKQYMTTLITNLCKPDHLVHYLKKVAGNIITAGEFCNYFEKCCKLVNKADWNASTDLVTMKSEFICESAMNRGLKEYKSIMNTKTDFLKPLITKNELDKYDADARREAKSRYTKQSYYSRRNNSHLYEEYMEKLMEEIQISFADYWENLRKRMMDHGIVNAEKAIGMLQIVHIALEDIIDEMTKVGFGVRVTKILAAGTVVASSGLCLIPLMFPFGIKGIAAGVAAGGGALLAEKGWTKENIEKVKEHGEKAKKCLIDTRAILTDVTKGSILAGPDGPVELEVSDGLVQGLRVPLESGPTAIGGPGAILSDLDSVITSTGTVVVGIGSIGGIDVMPKLKDSIQKLIDTVRRLQTTLNNNISDLNKVIKLIRMQLNKAVNGN